MAKDFLKTFFNRKRFQKLLFLVHFHAQMARDQISQFFRLTAFGNGGQSLFGDVFLYLRVTLKLFAH